MFVKGKFKILLSLVLALVITALTNNYLNSLKETTSVVVAKTEIKAFEKITLDKLQVIRIDKSAENTIAKNAFQTTAPLIGAVARVTIKPGTVVRKDPDQVVFDEKKIDALRSDGSVDPSFFVPYEKRALTLGLDAEGAINNKLKKGDWVDVIFTSIDDSTGGVYGAFIAQHVEIFDVQDIDFKSDSSMGKQGIVQQVTLLVTPQQAVDISLAKRKGVIDLALNPLAGETVILPPTSPLKFTQTPTEIKPKPSTSPKPIENNGKNNTNKPTITSPKQ